MPRVKINYVVSFSSEDPEHPASNLLIWEVSKKKWLCKRGESSCSVVLQLNKAVKISSVHIGVHHAAFVEVLVARSEEASDQYQVLVPSCVFVLPSEARREAGVERVRSFGAEQLAGAKDQLWDRVRVVCSQPYNKHCRYGLSFIHIDEAPEPTPLPAPVPQRLLTLDTFSSDEDDFRPGELFAEHLKSTDSQGNAPDTGAQIRQATSQALKNISDTCTKLMKTPISKRSPNREQVSATPEARADRTRDTLLYTDDDEKPHAKIDHVLQRHKHHKDKEEKAKPKLDKKDKEKLNESVHKVKDDSRTGKRKKSLSPPAPDSSSKQHNKQGDRPSSDKKHKVRDRKKRPRVDNELDEAEQASEEPHTLLKDVVMVLSGYENPQRANIRNTALALGARVQRDWGPHCTHLICAFPNTPKLRQVRATSGGDVPAVLADWVLQCSARRRRLPWQGFATEPARRAPPAAPRAAPSTPLHSSDTDCDTDDEIEKVRQQHKAKVADDGVPPPTDVVKRVLASDAEEGPSTDEEGGRGGGVPKFGGALPNFFDGYTFAIDADEPDADKLKRYVSAYGGLVLKLSELEEEESVDYVLSGRAAARVRGRRVTAAWLARCHRARALLTPD